MVINALALKLSVIENTANVIIQGITASIAIAKIVTIGLRLIPILISIRQMSNQNQKKQKLYALAQRAGAIKITANVSKSDKNVLRYADALAVKIMTKFRAKNIILIINAIQLIVFILLKIKFLWKI